MSEAYDLVVIGAGSGGVRAARMAATYGAKVAIIEEYRVGGTCVIRGCVPKKLFVYAIRFNDHVRDRRELRLAGRCQLRLADAGRQQGQGDRPARGGLRRGRSRSRASRSSATAPCSPGRNSVQLVEVGPRADRQDHPPRDRRPSLRAGHPGRGARASPRTRRSTSKALPHSILIEGGGYIARRVRDDLRRARRRTRRSSIAATWCCAASTRMCASASMPGCSSAASGSSTRPTSSSLREAGRRHRRQLLRRRRGAVRRGDVRDRPRGQRRRLSGSRTPASSSSPHRHVAVDKFSQTSNPAIYAVGDVTGRAQLTPVAIREGAAFAETVFNNNPTAVDHSLIADRGVRRAGGRRPSA